jgi:hypothetical protein
MPHVSKSVQMDPHGTRPHIGPRHNAHFDAELPDTTSRTHTSPYFVADLRTLEARQVVIALTLLAEQCRPLRSMF